MKTRYIYAAALSLLMGTASFAQQQLKFTSYTKQSDHYVKASAFVFLKTDYKVDLEKEFTSVLIKIPRNASLYNSYIVVNQDTIKFRKDGRTDPQVIGSQLIVFKTPQTQLVFHSEDISGKVEFNLFNSQPTAAVEAMEPLASAKAPVTHKTSLKTKIAFTNRKAEASKQAVASKQTEKQKQVVAQPIESTPAPLPINPPSAEAMAESTYSGQPLASLDRHESMHRHDGLDRHPDPYYKPKRKN